MAAGKNINLFLMDGNANGRIKCSISNWTGVVFKIPRSELNKCKTRDDLHQSGVYLLFGNSEAKKGIVYVGQARARKNGEGVLYRLKEHDRNPEKDYWNEAVIFTTQNNSFGPTEISYLENKFCKLAQEAGRYDVRNANEPPCGNITEEKECEMEEYIEYAKLIIGALGYKVFIPLNEKEAVTEIHDNPIEDNSPEDTESKEYYQLTRKVNGKVLRATCERTKVGYLVLAGSDLSDSIKEYTSQKIKDARAASAIGCDGKLMRSVLFKSPSGAASFVIGAAANGKTAWVNAEGKILKDVLKECSNTRED